MGRKSVLLHKSEILCPPPDVSGCLLYIDQWWRLGFKRSGASRRFACLPGWGRFGYSDDPQKTGQPPCYLGQIYEPACHQLVEQTLKSFSGEMILFHESSIIHA